MNAADLENLRGPILRSVSRSFYLSLRMLPGPLRDPLSLGYLLARATDTIADTPKPPVALRMESLRKLASAIQGKDTCATALDLRNSFAPLQTDEAERTLIDSLPSILEWLGALGDRDRDEIRIVLERINRGQMLDLERFGSCEQIRALATAHDLDEYTYLVAGCVGEFWTKLCFAHVPKFTQSPEVEMEASGVRYGKALQLINILRDVGSDLKQGRCYLPEEELKALGLVPTEILNDPDRVEPILTKWRDVAATDLAAGLEYSCVIENSRVRSATGLPALIGARTLALLRVAGPKAIIERVKVDRSEVQKLMFWAATPFASARGLRKRFEELSRSVT
jgi:farnesyl-diphosphate farnesyltransferase